jgi:hypothetical protein
MMEDSTDIRVSKRKRSKRKLSNDEESESEDIRSGCAKRLGTTEDAMGNKNTVSFSGNNDRGFQLGINYGPVNVKSGGKLPSKPVS